MSKPFKPKLEMFYVDLIPTIMCFRWDSINLEVLMSLVQRILRRGSQSLKLFHLMVNLPSNLAQRAKEAFDNQKLVTNPILISVQ